MKKLSLIIVLLCLACLTAGIRKAKNRTPPTWKNLEAKGDSAFHQYEIEDACQFWEEAIQENPDNLKVYNKLGISFLLLKEYEKAVDIFQDGLKLNSNSPDLNYNLALAHYYCGDFGEASRLLKKVLTINRDYHEANYLKGLCLEKMGRIEEAQRAYIQELNNNPGSRAAWRKVKVFSRSETTPDTYDETLEPFPATGT